MIRSLLTQIGLALVADSILFATSKISDAFVDVSEEIRSRNPALDRYLSTLTKDEIAQLRYPVTETLKQIASTALVGPFISSMNRAFKGFIGSEPDKTSTRDYVDMMGWLSLRMSTHRVGKRDTVIRSIASMLSSLILINKDVILSPQAFREIVEVTYSRVASNETVTYGASRELTIDTLEAVAKEFLDDPTYRYAVRISQDVNSMELQTLLKLSMSGQIESWESAEVI